MDVIPYGRQSIGVDDIKAVVGVLRSDWLTQGPTIRRFEDALCAYTGAKFAVCVSSGTAALHLACIAAGIRPGDEVITSPITFAASANCALYCGARPVFADIRPDTINIDPFEIQKKITKKTKALIPVHFAGRPCDMQEISRIADSNGLTIIEDAAHAIGSRYAGGGPVGNCHYSNMTVFSFHPVKTIATGEGGAITTNDKALYDKLLMLRNHGITRERALLTQDPGPWYYEMQILGLNYRLTDMQAALGMSQLKKIDKFVNRRREIVTIYNKAFRGIDWLKIPCEKNIGRIAFHLYVLKIDFDKLGITRSEVMKILHDKGIGTQVHYIPVYAQPYYKNRSGYKRGDCPVAEEYYEKALSIPLYPKMTDKDVRCVIKAIRELR